MNTKPFIIFKGKQSCGRWEHSGGQNPGWTEAEPPPEVLGLVSSLYHSFLGLEIGMFMFANQDILESRM